MIDLHVCVCRELVFFFKVSMCLNDMYTHTHTLSVSCMCVCLHLFELDGQKKTDMSCFFLFNVCVFVLINTEAISSSSSSSLS